MLVRNIWINVLKSFAVCYFHPQLLLFCPIFCL